MGGTRIVIREHGLKPRRISKVIPYKSGGFGITAPYHSARKGWLSKFPVDYSKTTIRTPIEGTTYTAEDRVKLSFHPDGFVQFSGEQPGRIVSGRDDSGEPKGLGIVINRLGTRLATVGPNFALGLWGLEDFEEAKNLKDAILFEEEDFYYRNCTESDWNAYLLEAFIFPRHRPLKAAVITPRGLSLSLRFPVKVRSETESGIILPSRTPLFEGPDTSMFNFRLVEVDDQPFVIAMMVTRTRMDFDSKSGFTLSGPSDLRNGLMAVYPAPGVIPELPTLDFTPTV